MEDGHIQYLVLFNDNSVNFVEFMWLDLRVEVYMSGFFAHLQGIVASTCIPELHLPFFCDYESFVVALVVVLGYGNHSSFNVM